MAKSSYVFETGQAVDIGVHGQSSYAFVSGEPLVNEGLSAYVFESGVGLRGGWEKEDNQVTPGTTIGGEGAELVLETDGSATSSSGADKFSGAWRIATVSAPIAITFEDVDFTANDTTGDGDPHENNFSLGLTDQTQMRVHEQNHVKSIYYMYNETFLDGNGDAQDYIAYNNGSS